MLSRLVISRSERAFRWRCSVSFRASISRFRGRLRAAEAAEKVILGMVFIAFGVLALTGLDKTLETLLLSASPAWLTAFTTSL
jgi:cytochrome c-type biogenesis protein